MAEAIVNLVLGKLADAVVRETLFPNGAGDKLDSLQHELRWIRAFVKDAESKRNSDERVKTWVNDVRDVAYRIEDVIDTFMAEVDDSNRPRIINLFMRVLKKPKLLPINHRLICEMNEIQARLCEIKECTDRYSIRELGDSSAVLTRRPLKAFMVPDMDDPDVIGLDADKENIINLLLNPNTPRRCVLSIVGQGGLGKTTLARKIYNRSVHFIIFAYYFMYDFTNELIAFSSSAVEVNGATFITVFCSYEVKKEFKFRLWLSISQQFKLLDLLKTMLERSRPLEEDEKALLQKEDPVSQQRAKEHFITKLNVSLQKIRYLIIMDDVWTQDLWIQVKEALPDIRNGSRVLLTTRSSDIARRADPISVPYYLSYLSEDESQKLVLKKAFPDQDPEAYLYELSDLPNKFARKCGGLPLALIVAGGLLSRQSPTYNSWHKILEKLSWHVDDGKMCTEILATSYEHMPAELKPCFMYFASFPEDYKIKAKSLIRMWVAEGFIPEVNNRIMEETAEDYLEELVQRYLLASIV
jgi:NB-ARC domain/Rx N-terminal domain